MIARWQFWNQGIFVMVRHTGNAEDMRIVCKCDNSRVANQLVRLLDNARHSTEEVSDLFSNLKEIKE